MEYRDFLLIIAGGIIGLFSNLVIEIYRKKSDDKEAFIAVKAEMQANIESAHRAEMSTYLWSDNVYKANLNHLKLFKNRIKDVVQFYFKIENYKYRYLLYIELLEKLNNLHSERVSKYGIYPAFGDEANLLLQDIKFTKQQVTNENNALLSLAKEIAKLGETILK